MKVLRPEEVFQRRVEQAIEAINKDLLLWWYGQEEVWAELPLRNYNVAERKEIVDLCKEEGWEASFSEMSGSASSQMVILARAK